MRAVLGLLLIGENHEMLIAPIAVVLKGAFGRYVPGLMGLGRSAPGALLFPFAVLGAIVGWGDFVGMPLHHGGVEATDDAVRVQGGEFAVGVLIGQGDASDLE